MTLTTSSRALLSLLVAFLTACGATADPLPPADGGTADARPFGPHGCRFGEARLAGTCVPFNEQNCGAIGRACPPGHYCAVHSDGTTTSVRCFAN